MPDQRVIEQVVGIFGMNDVTYKIHENKRSLLVPYGSAGIFLDFVDFGESTVLAFRANVLETVDATGERRVKILEELNEENKRVRFGKFYFDFDTNLVVLEYDLFATDLQASEVMDTLSVIANLADSSDDALSEKLGSGVRAQDAWNAAQTGASEPGGTGPVVEA
jgi:T3SS (YopN, CesT) and YbjN peptide-binding chaperone 1